MIDFLQAVLLFLFRAVSFALDIAVSISQIKKFAVQVTGSDKIVEVPPEPKVLPPAAQRALAEAEMRRDLASFVDNHREPSGHGRTAQAANGTLQAS
jgi:hypothetical protein